MTDVTALRAALRCKNPRCSCQRERGNVHCSSHEDQRPSLSISERDGRVLVHCFSGCDQSAVIEALRSRGLWTGKPPAPVLSRLVRARDGQGHLDGPLNDAARFVEKYVQLPSDHAVTAVALWTAHCYVLNAFDVSPYLIVTSPEKRSGKTRLLEVLELLVPRPWRVVQPSEATLFRKISKSQPTLLLDEADTIFHAKSNGAEPLRALLNSGNRRGVTVPRCVGEGAKITLVDFPVFCAKALAAIGSLPDTVEDRGIVIRMNRATPTEQRQIIRLRFGEAAAEAAPIREALAKWAEAALPRLREARPAIPEELDGRAADGWEPLLAVADAAGDGWFVAAWAAALALSTGESRWDDSIRVRLLADIKRVFEEKQAERLATSDLIEALCEDEATPWGDWHGRRITPQALARLLRQFQIRPTQWREGLQAGLRGYTREAFLDAWGRYLPSSPSPPSVPEPLHSLQLSQDAGFSDFEEPLHPPSVADCENGANTDRTRVVASVAVSNPYGGEEADSEAPEDVPERVPLTPPDGACYACGHARYWQSVYGPLICATCHPPATSALVARWWVRRPFGRWLPIRPVHQVRRWRCTSPPEVVRAAVGRFLTRREAPGA